MFRKFRIGMLFVMMMTLLAACADVTGRPNGLVERNGDSITLLPAADGYPAGSFCFTEKSTIESPTTGAKFTMEANTEMVALTEPITLNLETGKMSDARFLTRPCGDGSIGIASGDDNTDDGDDNTDDGDDNTDDGDDNTDDGDDNTDDGGCINCSGGGDDNTDDGDDNTACKATAEPRHLTNEDNVKFAGNRTFVVFWYPFGMKVGTVDGTQYVFALRTEDGGTTAHNFSGTILEFSLDCAPPSEEQIGERFGEEYINLSFNLDSNGRLETGHDIPNDKLLYFESGATFRVELPKQ